MASPKAPDTVIPGKLGDEDFWSLPDDGKEMDAFEPKAFPGLTVSVEGQFDSSDFQGLDSD